MQWPNKKQRSVQYLSQCSDLDHWSVCFFHAFAVSAMLDGCLVCLPSKDGKLKDFVFLHYMPGSAYTIKKAKLNAWLKNLSGLPSEMKRRVGGKSI